MSLWALSDRVGNFQFGFYIGLGLILTISNNKFLQCCNIHVLHGQYIRVTILACLTLPQVDVALGKLSGRVRHGEMFSVCLAFVLTTEIHQSVP